MLWAIIILRSAAFNPIPVSFSDADLCISVINNTRFLSFSYGFLHFLYPLNLIVFLFLYWGSKHKGCWMLCTWCKALWNKLCYWQKFFTWKIDQWIHKDISLLNVLCPLRWLLLLACLICNERNTSANKVPSSKLLQPGSSPVYY